MNRLVISVVTITILALAMQAIKLFDILKRKHLNGLSKIPKSNWNTQINIVSAFMVLTTAQTAYCADDLSGNVVNQNQPSVQFKLQSSNSFNGANIVGPRLTLPEAIERLEGSNERFAVIQSLADVFTAAASETPPARTSYKYVSRATQCVM